MKTNLKRIFSFIVLPSLVFFCLGTIAQAFSIPPEGQAVVTDPLGGTNGDGALFIVDLNPAAFGQRVLVSDFGNPAQGPLGDDPSGVALDSLVDALVIDDNAGTNDLGALFHVNLRTGNRTIVSDFGDPAQGPVGRDPLDLALDGLGNAFVIDETVDTGALFSVDLSNGQRTIISDFSDPAQGPIGFDPLGVVLDGAGNALVIDDDAGTSFDGALFRVDLTTGDRTIISNFGEPAQGPIGSTPTGITLDGSGNALVVDENEGTENRGLLFRVDLTTGDRTIISNFGNPAQGPVGLNPRGITLDGSGNALVVDEDEGTDSSGLLFRVDLTTGQRTIISNFGNPAQGPLGEEPTGIAFRSAEIVRPIPTLSEWGLIATAVILGLAGLYAVRRRRVSA